MPSRRMFLAGSGRTALGLSLLPLAAWLPALRRRAKSLTRDAPTALIADLQAQIPSLNGSRSCAGAVDLDHSQCARGVESGLWREAQRLRRLPLDTDTLFEVGSVSKTVFAYAVMKICEKGILDLDTPITKYVSERSIRDDPRFNQITTRHVLSHTSGLQNWRSTEEPLRIHFAPGAKWLYSGEGYSYLQLVVAHLTGRVSTQSCETLFDGATACASEIDGYLKANLLRPFGMPSSGYVQETASEHTAAAHDRNGKPTNRPGPTAIMAARYGAAGGLSTTATEYARFLIEVLDPKPSDAFRLTRAGRDEMIRPQVKVDDTSSWSLGWRIMHHNKGNLLSHGGDNPGFKAFVLASVERRAGYVILTNGDNGGEVIGKLTNGDTSLNAFVTG